jgi:hypothetical protein
MFYSILLLNAFSFFDVIPIALFMFPSVLIWFPATVEMLSSVANLPSFAIEGIPIG